MMNKPIDLICFLPFQSAGTLLAIATTYITYIAYGVIISGVTERDASGNITEYLAWANRDNGPMWTNVSYYFNDCTNRTHNGDDYCLFGSANDQQVCLSYSEVHDFSISH